MILSIDRQAEQERKRAACIQALLLWGLSIGVLGIAFGIILFLLLTHAAASAVCLTKKEARHLWPRQHIYWYSKDHCWSNRRGRPPSNLKFDPVFSSNKAHAESLPASPQPPAPTQDAGKADRADVPDAPQPTKRGTVRTIPIVKEWQNDFEDYCCWPMIEPADADSERERAFRILADKMREKKLYGVNK